MFTYLPLLCSALRAALRSQQHLVLENSASGTSSLSCRAPLGGRALSGRIACSGLFAVSDFRNLCKRFLVDIWGFAFAPQGAVRYRPGGRSVKGDTSKGDRCPGDGIRVRTPSTGAAAPGSRGLGRGGLGDAPTLERGTHEGPRARGNTYLPTTVITWAIIADEVLAPHRVSHIV